MECLRLDMYGPALICDHNLQVYFQTQSTSREVLSGAADGECLGRIVQSHLLSESVLSYVNKLSCSLMSPGNKYWLSEHRPISDERHVSQRGKFQ